MANPADVQDCKRYRVMIDDEHFYFAVGENFVHATVPYENRPDRAQLRKIVDQVCKEITKILGGEVQEC